MTQTQCPNCGSFKVWRRGKAWLWGGIVWAVLSAPWVLLFPFLGIPSFLASVVIALAGLADRANDWPYHCRNCDWVEGQAIQRMPNTTMETSAERMARWDAERQANRERKT